MKTENCKWCVFSWNKGEQDTQYFGQKVHAMEYFNSLNQDCLPAHVAEVKIFRMRDQVFQVKEDSNVQKR